MGNNYGETKSRYALGLLRLFLDRFEKGPLWKTVSHIYSTGLIPAQLSLQYHVLKRRLYDEPFLSLLHWDGKHGFIV